MRYYVIIKKSSGEAGAMLSGGGNSCKVDESKSGVCETRSEIVSGNDVANIPITCEAGVVLSGDGNSCKSDKTKSGVCEPRSEIVGDNDVATAQLHVNHALRQCVMTTWWTTRLCANCVLTLVMTMW